MQSLQLHAEMVIFLSSMTPVCFTLATFALRFGIIHFVAVYIYIYFFIFMHIFELSVSY